MQTIKNHVKCQKLKETAISFKIDRNSFRDIYKECLFGLMISQIFISSVFIRFWCREVAVMKCQNLIIFALVICGCCAKFAIPKSMKNLKDVRILRKKDF